MENTEAEPMEVRAVTGWQGRSASESEPIYVETGRGQSVPVNPGEPFTATIERIADEAHYGGYFRVHLNGEEILEPGEAPETFQPGMRVNVSPYDKVGA